MTTHTNLKAIEILRAARDVITPPEMWTKGLYGADGCPHCAAGAVLYVARHENQRARDKVWDLLEADLGERTLEDWNDDEDRTHSEVLARFDAAIAKAEALTDEERT